jgi:very-short-patch-repair endonuclease
MPYNKTPGYIFDICRKLRKRQTNAERLLWKHLRKRQLKGLKFRRQHPLGRYIADYYCPEARLVVELNGKMHDHENQQEYDKMRNEIIEVHRIKVLRIKNEEIEQNIGKVLKKIADLTSIPESPT